MHGLGRLQIDENRLVARIEGGANDWSSANGKTQHYTYDDDASASSSAEQQ